MARFNLEQIMSMLKRKNMYEEVMNEQSEEDAAPSIMEEYQVKVEEQKKELAQKH